MPVYEYICRRCDKIFESILPISRRAEPQKCPECGSGGERIMSLTGFVLNGDGWPSKAIRVREQMLKRRDRVGKKEDEKRRDGFGMKLAPNVGGEEVDSWREARKLAESKGKDTSTYDGLVRAEGKG